MTKSQEEDWEDDYVDRVLLESLRIQAHEKLIQKWEVMIAISITHLNYLFN